MSGMTPAHRSLLRDRLTGIEFRNQQRASRRRAIYQASFERQQQGTQRPYLAYERSDYPNPLTASLQNKNEVQK
jgi:hypothetical protein